MFQIVCVGVSHVRVHANVSLLLCLYPSVCVCLSLFLFVYVSVFFCCQWRFCFKKKKWWKAEKNFHLRFKFFLMGGAVGNRYDGVLHNRCYRCVLRLFCV